MASAIDRLLEAAVVEDAGDASHRHAVLGVGLMVELLSAAPFENVQVIVSRTASGWLLSAGPGMVLVRLPVTRTESGWQLIHTGPP